MRGAGSIVVQWPVAPCVEGWPASGRRIAEAHEVLPTLWQPRLRLARLQLARGDALRGESVKAKTDLCELPRVVEDADPDIPILKRVC